MSKALMIIDVQASLFLGPWPVPGAPELLQRIGDRILKARLEGESVIHVQNDGPDDEMDAPGEPWWELVLHAKENELVVRKTHQNVFESNPDLADELKTRGITDLEFVGVQSDMCLGASARAAHELGFKILVQRDLHATYDGGYPGSEDPTPAGEISDRIQRELEALK
jgi:nicotinamidase-related amidase